MSLPFHVGPSGFTRTASLVQLHLFSFTCSSSPLRSLDRMSSPAHFIVTCWRLDDYYASQASLERSVSLETSTLRRNSDVLLNYSSAAVILPGLRRKHQPTRWHNTRASASRMRRTKRLTKQTTLSGQKATKTRDGVTSIATRIQVCLGMCATTCSLPASSTATRTRPQA